MRPADTPPALVNSPPASTLPSGRTAIVSTPWSMPGPSSTQLVPVHFETCPVLLPPLKQTPQATSSCDGRTASVPTMPPEQPNAPAAPLPSADQEVPFHR